MCRAPRPLEAQIRVSWAWVQARRDNARCGVSGDGRTQRRCGDRCGALAAMLRGSTSDTGATAVRAKTLPLPRGFPGRLKVSAQFVLIFGAIVEGVFEIYCKCSLTSTAIPL